MTEEIRQIVESAERIVVIQADNPDADSLGSALALEQILSELGKKVYLYCGVETPGYLKYLEGWSRINQELPSNFDASIIVDASTITLLEKLQTSGQLNWLATKPCIILDHHATTDDSITFATVSYNDPTMSSTGEMLFDLAASMQWPIDITSGEYVMTAILGDTQGLTNELTSARTYQIMAALTELGVSRVKLEELRRDASKMDPKIFKYKAALIDRTQLLADRKLAIVTVPQEEISEYSPLYNPAPLIQQDMLMTQGVAVAIVVKHYADGKILGSIRANKPIAGQIAESFSGGGHAYAAGFKLQDNTPVDQVVTRCEALVSELLNDQGEHNAAI